MANSFKENNGPKRNRAPTNKGTIAQEQAAAAKKVGNGFYEKKEYEKAIEQYTTAIGLYDQNHIYYSNRSACYAETGKFQEALDDGLKCVELKPEWAKGYYRVGLALFKLGKIDEAKQTYENGLKVDDNNVMKSILETGIAQCEQADSKDGDVPMNDKQSEVGLTAEEKLQREEEEKEREIQRMKEAEALKFKEAGNVLYKEKKYKEAIAEYKKAQEIDPKKSSYVLNESAALFMMEEWDETMACCQRAIDVAREHFNDLKWTFKAYNRMGSVEQKRGNAKKAVEYYKKALVEKKDPKLRKLVQKMERVQVRKEKEALLDPELVEKLKNECNEASLQLPQFGDAIAKYTEALKWYPKDHKIYSNRAWCFYMLFQWDAALADYNAAIKLEPTFIEAYIRKGKIYHCLKQYHKALQAYKEAALIDDKVEDLITAKRDTLRAIQTRNMSGQFSEEDRQRALQDPEVQAVMNDSEVSSVLLQAQRGDQTILMRAMRDRPKIKDKIEYLMAAGVLQLEQKLARKLLDPEHAENEDSDIEMEEKLQREEEEKERGMKEAEALKFEEAGVVLFQKKKYKEAIAEYKKAQEIDPRQGLYVLREAAALFKLEEWDETMACCQRTIDVAREQFDGYKWTFHAYEHMGAVEQKRGNSPKAVQYWKKALMERKDPILLKQLQKMERVHAKMEREAQSFEDPIDGKGILTPIAEITRCRIPRDNEIRTISIGGDTHEFPMWVLKKYRYHRRFFWLETKYGEKEWNKVAAQYINPTRYELEEMAGLLRRPPKSWREAGVEAVGPKLFDMEFNNWEPNSGPSGVEDESLCD